MAPRFSVAPIVEWTDRHCRIFIGACRAALLHTEILAWRTLLHADPDRLPRHSPSEHPLAPADAPGFTTDARSGRLNV